MAEITLVGVKYTTIDDKTAMASISDEKGRTLTILKKVKIDGKEYTVTKVGDLKSATLNKITVSIPDSVTSIGKMERCSNITIPDSVTSIGSMSDCSNITIPDSVTSIGELYNCSNINITIPDSVTSIGNMWRCSNMKINFHKGIKSLNGISGLNDITIPDSVTSIWILDNCSNITIPDSVTSIKELYNCSNITIPESITALKYIRCCTITIPASVSTINEISGENGSLMLMMESTTPPTLAKAIYLAKDDTLTVPVGAAEAYKKHPVWGKFKNISERNISASTNTKKAEPKPQPTPEPVKETPKPQPAPAPKTEPKAEPVKEAPKAQPAPAPKTEPKAEPVKETPKAQPAPAPKAEPKKEAPKPEVKRPSADDMNVLDKLIDAALEDFVLTDEERSVLLKKSKEIGLGEDEFKIYLNGKIQERMKDKPAEKVEEKKKGFFARLFGL